MLFRNVSKPQNKISCLILVSIRRETSPTQPTNALFSLTTPPFPIIRSPMNFKKLLLGLWLLTLLSACNLSPAAILGPTATPSMTPSPSITPSPTPTITPSPVPTIIPLARVGIGEKALSNGDYTLARAEFQVVVNTSTDDELRAAALWGLVRVNYEDEHDHEAIAFALQLENEYPDSPFLAYAHFLAGKANRNIGRHQAATEAYAAYLELRPDLLKNYVEEIRGDIFVEMGDYASALNAYQAALIAPSLSDSINLEVKIATSKAALGDFAGALADYDSISQRSNNDFIKAQMDYFSGFAHLMLADEEEGYTRYLHTVENYPLAYHSYLALLELVEAGIPVNNLSRGITDYAAEQYDVALVALDRYIAETPENDGTAAYYRAKTLYAMGRYDDEVAAWTHFIENYPEHRYWSEAWEEKSYTQWHDLKQLQAGKETLLTFVSSAPTHSEAPRLLMNAACLMERNEKEEEAITLWLRLSDEYPGSNLAPEALFLAGVTTYRLNDYAQSLTFFQRGLLLVGEKEEQARSFLWIGKAQEKLGELEAAQDAWQQAQSINSSDYYSVRARDLLIGAAPFSIPNIYNPDTDPAKEHAEAASWLRITFNLPADTDLDSLGALESDIRLQRGREYWELGLYDEARLEFESLRATVSKDAADSFRLANYMLDLGLYRPAIFAARQVLDLAGMKNHAETLHAPAYFNHIRYGIYYSDLVEPAAEKHEFHPIFIYSLMRQESLFEGFVHSAAGARGLMQVIPATGANIASQNNWLIEYTAEDLYRPMVSVRFGTWYLASNRELLDNDLYATLAAYNGGPGNAIEWQRLASGDPDLFLESVRFTETRNYIRAIYETYRIYESIYSTGQ
jgi:soluble lytic murein transglycosylase